MSTLLFVGICLAVLGVGGRVAIGRGDASRRKSALKSGAPEPRPSKGSKRVANTGAGAGIVAIIVSLIFGGGAGLGLGPGIGTGTESNAQAVESSVSSEVESATIEEARKAAQDSDTLMIRVKEKNIFINDYLCTDIDEFGKTMEDFYEDGMNITVIDDYADSEPYSSVTGYLKDNAYEYLVEAK